MKKKDLRVLSGISQTSIAKLSKNENVTTDILVKICVTLNCDIGDIAQIVDQKTNYQNMVSERLEQYE